MIFIPFVSMRNTIRIDFAECVLQMTGDKEKFKMVNSEIKNTAQSALRDTKSTLRDASNTLGSAISNSSMNNASSSAINEPVSKISDRIESLKDTAQNFANDASPRVKEAYNQVSDVASDLYERASGWLSEGNNKNYGFVAMVAAVGVLGFFLGRGSRSDSEI
jgi:ElaB/YqjD/DUF883 family membrane-anchored ribosome-binding protein